MKNKLLLALLLAGASCQTTLMASASDDPAALGAPLATAQKTPEEWLDRLTHAPTSLSPQDCLDAITCFGEHPDFVDHQALGIYRYLTLVPLEIQEGPHDTHDLSSLAFMNKIFSLCTVEEKLSYKDSFLPLMRYLLKHDETLSWQSALQMVDDFLVLDDFDGAKEASRRYVNCPNVAATYKEVSLRAATAHSVLGNFQQAGILYDLSRIIRPGSFTRIDLQNACDTFKASKNYEKGAEYARLLLEKNGTTYKYADLLPDDFLSAALLFSSAKSPKEAFDAINIYFERETDTPHGYAYTLMADYYMSTRTHLELACEYWDLALRSGVPLTYIDCQNAYQVFSYMCNEARGRDALARSFSCKPEEKTLDMLIQDTNIFLKANEYERAKQCADTYVDRLNTAHSHEEMVQGKCTAARAYAMNKDFDTSARLWIELVNEKDLHPFLYVIASSVLIKTIHFSYASDYILKLVRDHPDFLRTNPDQVKISAFYHIVAGRTEEAVHLLKTYGSKAAPIKRERKTKSILSHVMSQDKAMIQTLKNDLGTKIFQDITKAASAVRGETRPGLLALKSKILKREQKATLLKNSLGTGTHSGMTASSVSSSSGAAAPSEPTPQDPFLALQKLQTQIEILKRDFDREKMRLDRQDFKDAKKALLLKSLHEAPIEWPQPSATRMPTHAKPQKGKKQKVVARALSSSSASSASSASSSSSSSSSSSTPALRPSSVEWRITPTAQKHLKSLKTVRGLQEKFDAFRHEIEMEPWGRRGQCATHASGRAKRLKGHDNVFSRRFSKGERFFYRVEHAGEDRVIVTILGLMEHDL